MMMATLSKWRRLFFGLGLTGRSQFSYVGDSIVVSFLRSVGKEMPEMNQYWMEKHLKGE